jgi:threonine synthase
LLFDYYGRKGATLTRAMARFRRTGAVSFGKNRWRRMRRLFAGRVVDDENTTASIRRLYQSTGELLDPHSAIGVAAGMALRQPDPSALICVATAHPAKFPDAVEAATGIRPALPARLQGLFERRERCQTLPKELGAVQDFIATRLADKVAT